MPDIFDEVDDDLRAERARSLLRRFGGLALLAAVLIVAGAGAYEWWKARSDRLSAAAAETYLDAQKVAASPPGSPRQQAEPDFARLAAEAPAGYRTLARLQEAALKADAGDLAGAAAIWQGIAGDSAVDPLLRDLATLTWARHEVDKGDPKAVAARLQPLARPDNLWHGLAEETLALLAIRQGHVAEARDTLDRLRQDVTAPQPVRSRAAGLLGRLGA